MAENKPAKKHLEVANANLTNPSGMLELAGTVKQFILEQKLFTAIQGRNYVNVEGWQFAGGMIGVLPVVQSTENLSSGDELKYRASVQLINIATDKLVGSGIATCSNKEKGKKYFDEYAIESMAQTRAVGKAYRLMLGWLMKAAGYEATPAEEMDFQTAEVVECRQPEQPKAHKITAENADVYVPDKHNPTANIYTPPVMQTAPEYASEAIKSAMFSNLNGFKGLYTDAEYAKTKAGINSLLAEGAEDAKKKLQGSITKRLVAKRAELNHACTKAQLDLIDKMLLSHKFTAEEKAALNTASYEYDNIDAANRIDWLTAQSKERNGKVAA